MASVSVLNSIGTVVHNSPDKAVSVLGSFGTVVHDVAVTLDTVSVLGSFGTVVHDTPPALQAVSVPNMFGTAIHDSNFVFNVSDITGTVGNPATFSGSTQGFPVADYAHEWSWVSVPGGSSYANQSIPMPDNNANTYFNMTDNQGLVSTLREMLTTLLETEEMVQSVMQALLLERLVAKHISLLILTPAMLISAWLRIFYTSSFLWLYG